MSRQLRIATWNLAGASNRGHRDETCAYLRDLGIDVALVQEAQRPPWPDVRTVPSPDPPERWSTSEHRPWIAAIAVFDPQFALEPIKTRQLAEEQTNWREGVVYVSHPGSVALAIVTPEDARPIVLASAYGLLTGYNSTIRDRYSTTSLNRLLSDLTPLLDSPRGRRLVLAGDLNTGGTQWRPGTAAARWGPLHTATLERFRAFGLVDCVDAKLPADRGPLPGCPCGRQDCRHYRTLRLHGKPDSTPSQADWFWATRRLAPSLTTCEVLDDPRAWELSDHAPIVASFAL